MDSDRGMARLVDRGTLNRGLDCARRGLVTTIGPKDGPGELFGVVQGSGPDTFYETATHYELNRAGAVTVFDSWCSCPVETSCKHAVALLFTALAERPERSGRAVQVVNSWASAVEHELVPYRPFAPPRPERRLTVVGPPTQPAAWELALAEIVSVVESDSPNQAEPLGLMFEFVPPRPAITGVDARHSIAAQKGLLAVRPVRLGQRGSWVRSGVSWSDLKYGIGRDRFREEHYRTVAAIGQLSPTRDYSYYRTVDAWLHLDSLNGAALWSLLGQAADHGVSLTSDQKGQPAVRLSERPADLSLQVGRDELGVRMVPTITVDDSPVPPDRCMFLGEPAHGLVTWSLGPGSHPAAITLARLESTGDPSVLKLFSAGGIRIPVADEARFLNLYIPELRRRHKVIAVEGMPGLPEEHAPVLTLSVQPLPQDRVHLEWAWLYRVGDSERRLRLQPGPADQGRRDHSAERRVLAEITPLLEKVGRLVSPTDRGMAPVAQAITDGWDTIDLVNTILPMLREHPSVEVELLERLPFYQPAAQEPVVVLSSTPSGGSNDWFDLGITITLGDEEVPFEQLFRALATDQEVMILPDGSYFALDREEFRQLRMLIDEARSLQDRPDGRLRISRFQAGLWDELEKLGVVDAQSTHWLSKVRGWRSEEMASLEPPAGLDAHLRPYQLDGYRWMNLLRENELGGILADDMGLGKTIQALAMMGRAREQDPDGPPFLVIAPTSVITNWQAEAVRFLPGAKTLVISETEVRRGSPLAEAVAGMDIVITSYTLFRLEFDDYREITFAGLIMDEAQAVKNHQSKVFACVKALSVPFKFAVTGTPMENNLMELWALFSLVAPGLFPNPSRFSEYYRIPIERGHQPELLARLRRRIHPLMLRRTKEQVAIDLPAKQEQVLELELEPAHRLIYQRYLQRERQKVLGLLGDMEKNRFAIFRSLMVLRQASIDPFLVDCDNEKVASTKLNVLMELLTDVVKEGHRTLVFSQFTGFLSRVRGRLDQEGIDYCYLDGSTRNRPQVIDEFRGGTAPVFLISLKAGGVGLNLTEADYCIILDPWWNPATEAQAVDRTHRIGQTKKVMVYRLVSKDTIEEKVRALKESKARLFAGVMSDDGTVGKAISAADIRELLS